MKKRAKITFILFFGILYLTITGIAPEQINSPTTINLIELSHVAYANGEDEEEDPIIVPESEGGMLESILEIFGL